MTLTKAMIVDNIHEQLGYPKNKSDEMLETLLELIGFGKFCVKEKNQRRGRNPATGQDMILDQRRVVTFRCSHLLREKINNEF